MAPLSRALRGVAFSYLININIYIIIILITLIKAIMQRMASGCTSQYFQGDYNRVIVPGSRPIIPDSVYVELRPATSLSVRQEKEPQMGLDCVTNPLENCPGRIDCRRNVLGTNFLFFQIRKRLV